VSGIDGSDAVLDIQPFPVDYRPAKAVATGGNGKTIRVGWATATWHFAGLPAPHMQQLFTARDNALTLNDGLCYIVTATDTISLQLDSVSGWQTTRPVYSKFSASIWDITWEEKGNYAYSNVVVEFRHLKLV
jgi:hypothetical protein